MEDGEQRRDTPRRRTRTGCLNCRRRRRKCDEHRPSCGACGRRSEPCEWGLKISFREENASSINGAHPSMRRGRHGGGPREYEILDVTAEVIRDYGVSSPSPDPEDRRECCVQEEMSEYGLSGSVRHGWPYSGESPIQSSPAGIESLPGRAMGPPPTTGLYGPSGDERSPSSARQTDAAVANLMYLSQGGGGGSQSLSTVPMDMVLGDYIDHIQAFTPDGPSEDGVFLPGSAYHELHSTLRNHIIQEVQSICPTRQVTPETSSHSNTVHSEPELTSISATAVGDLVELQQILDRDEEILLWRNWIDEIAPWLDKFDRDCHFQYVIPTMAADHDHLRYAVLALSARQIELKETTLPNDRSLALYQQAIHLLLPHLPTRSTAVIASCVILCVLEMLSCSPKAWRRHLDGCASLMEAVGINGFVGGVEEALFWCFARMDVCGGLISSVRTLIPARHWAAAGTNENVINHSLEADAALFQAKASFHSWANYTVYLVAQVLDLLAPVTIGSVSRAAAQFRTRWLSLWRLVSSWYTLRPPALRAILVVPSSSAAGRPFPTIIFSNPAGISGNQLHHTASILMLQNQPPGVRISSASSPAASKPKSILWHARQVCGISISNDHHGAWTNGVQPLWIAGKCMSHPEEHRAILDMLERIERESGWKTRWRAEDLKEHWGDLGD